MMHEYHDEDFHRYTFVSDDESLVRFEISNTYQDKSGVWGEVSVYDVRHEQERPLFEFTRLNLITENRPGMDVLDYEFDAYEPDRWYEQVKAATVRAIRKPPKPDAMVASDPDEVTTSFLIKPFILSDGVSLLFGPGGTGKSMLALAMALAVVSGRAMFGRPPAVTGNVIYLDYEDSLRTHEARMRSLMVGMGLDDDDLEHTIFHLKPTQSVARMRRDLLGLIREHQPALIIVDSVGLARGGDAMGSEDTIRLFGTLASLSIPVLGIDHMTKEDVRGGKMVTPYGSIYTVNSVRLAWSVKAADISDDTNTYLNFVQTKRNNVARHAPIGAHMEFVNEVMDFGGVKEPVLRQVRIAQADVFWQPESESVIDRAVEWLSKNEKGSTAELATALGVGNESVGATLRREAAKDDPKVVRIKNGNLVIWRLPDE